jgi:hypothetical protein
MYTLAWLVMVVSMDDIRFARGVEVQQAAQHTDRVCEVSQLLWQLLLFLLCWCLLKFASSPAVWLLLFV